MNTSDADGRTYTLWGAACSLYTGKIRSYLIKKGLPYRELYPSDSGFRSRAGNSASGA